MNNNQNQTFLSLFTVGRLSFRSNESVTRGLERFFPDFVVKVDSLISEFIGFNNHYEVKKPFQARLYEGPAGGKFNELKGSTNPLEPNELIGLSRYFGSQGRKFLNIPSRQDKAVVLLGSIAPFGEERAVVIEHKLEEKGTSLSILLRQMKDATEYPLFIARVGEARSIVKERLDKIRSAGRIHPVSSRGR